MNKNLLEAIVSNRISFYAFNIQCCFLHECFICRDCRRVKLDVNGHEPILLTSLDEKGQLLLHFTLIGI